MIPDPRPGLEQGLVRETATELVSGSEPTRKTAMLEVYINELTDLDWRCVQGSERGIGEGGKLAGHGVIFNDPTRDIRYHMINDLLIQLDHGDSRRISVRIRRVMR